MSLGRRDVGVSGENQAADFLETKHLKIKARGFQTRWGEIDLICHDGDTWVFVEVKTRSRQGLPSALDALTLSKQKKIVQTAIAYMKMHRLAGQNMRFDVVTVEAGHLDWIPGAFEPTQRYTL